MTYAHDAHCNTVHEAGPDPCPPAHELDEILANAYDEAVIVRPGDTLVIRVPQLTSREQADRMVATIRERYAERDLGLLIVAAEQILVYRPGGAE